MGENELRNFSYYLLRLMSINEFDRQNEICRSNFTSTKLLFESTTISLTGDTKAIISVVAAKDFKVCKFNTNKKVIKKINITLMHSTHPKYFGAKLTIRLSILQ